MKQLKNRLSPVSLFFMQDVWSTNERFRNLVCVCLEIVFVSLALLLIFKLLAANPDPFEWGEPKLAMSPTSTTAIISTK